MRIQTRTAALLSFMACFAAAALLAGCDTGFGQPCTLPKTDEFRQACNPAEVDPAAEDEDVQSESRASCAVKNFAGCETRVCLVYRGSSPFCSEPCLADDDCEGSAVCRPLLGDVECAEGVECYCVRKGDIDN